MFVTTHGEISPVSFTSSKRIFGPFISAEVKIVSVALPSGRREPKFLETNRSEVDTKLGTYKKETERSTRVEPAPTVFVYFLIFLAPRPPWPPLPSPK
jgi:hypothetical protein